MDLRTLAADQAQLRRHYYGQGLYSPAPLGELLAQGAWTTPDTIMHFYSQTRPGRVTLSEVFERSRKLAGALHRRGLRPGDVICVQLPNWVEGAVLYGAAFMAGLVVVPVVHIYGPAELGFIIRQSGAKALFMPDRWRSIDYLDRLERIGDPAPLEHVVIVGEEVPAGGLTFDELEREGTADVPLGHVGSDDICMLVYTSGTTSEPKGVQHTHNSLAAEVSTGFITLAKDPDPAYLFTLPAGHIGGVLGCLIPFLTGAPGYSLDQWDAEVAAGLVEKHRLTRCAGTPYQLMTLMDAVDEHGVDASSISHWSVGGAGVPPSLIERAEALGWRAARSYGSTEHPTVTAGYDDDSLDKRASTDGRALRGTEVRVVDEAGRELPSGAAGEIVIRGPELMIGYRREDLNEDAFLPGGWFRTGDIGVVDPDGYLTVTDRLKDVVIRGGENISSTEVEGLLLRHHPDVLEVAVVGVPDERYGERVCACVKLRPGTSLSLDAVRESFRSAGVAIQKAPERIEVVQNFPRTPAGKVKKFELRAELRTRDIR